MSEWFKTIPKITSLIYRSSDERFPTELKSSTYLSIPGKVELLELPYIKVAPTFKAVPRLPLPFQIRSLSVWVFILHHRIRIPQGHSVGFGLRSSCTGTDNRTSRNPIRDCQNVYKDAIMGKLVI